MRNQFSGKYPFSVQRPHLVLIGAGASRAAFPNGEKNGLIPPLMNDFFDIVKELSDYLKKHGIEYEGKNFEDVYSSMYENSKYNEIRPEVEEIVYNYFSRMELPDEPTLYDHLVLSLTGRDAIATFNWDPFIWQAMCRNVHRVGDSNIPYAIYLHGNAAIGKCTVHDIIQMGTKGSLCVECGKKLEKSKLLYPIKQKDYNSDPFIKSSWDDVKNYLHGAFMFTVFGYGAPSSDVEAVRLLQEGWGNKYQRDMEQIEIIDTLEDDILFKRWKNFINEHHYTPYKDFYSSLIARCAIRSCDVCFHSVINRIGFEEHPILKDASWDELDEWLKPLLEEENSKRQN